MSGQTECWFSSECRTVQLIYDNVCFCSIFVTGRAKSGQAKLGTSKWRAPCADHSGGYREPGENETATGSRWSKETPCSGMSITFDFLNITSKYIHFNRKKHV